jgi:hypothetical protein
MQLQGPTTQLLLAPCPGATGPAGTTHLGQAGLAVVEAVQGADAPHADVLVV